MRKSIRQKLANSKRRIQRRLDKTNLRGCSKPILTASNLHYEIAERTRRAIVQEGEWIINQRKRGPTSTARPGAGRRRCVVVNQEIVALRTRDLRLFKGCVVLWTNCRHPYYDANPFPEKAPTGRKVWVGDMWPFFYAGHKIELDNLKHILEYRHTNGLAMMIGGPS